MFETADSVVLDEVPETEPDDGDVAGALDAGSSKPFAGSVGH